MAGQLHRIQHSTKAVRSAAYIALYLAENVAAAELA
jgi:S-adenosylmethionine synthetase